MPVIKSPDIPASLAPFSMRDIEQQAALIVARAKQQAATLLSEAARIAQLMKARAEERGFEEGKRAGNEEGMKLGHEAARVESLDEQRAALAELVATLTAAATEIDAARRALESEAVVDVMKLAISIARKVTKKKGLADATVMTANVIEAMRLAVRASDVRIAIHSTQRAAMDAALPQLKLQWPKLEHVELIDDDTLSPGGCRIFTGGGEIDGDLDGQVDRIAADLLPTKTETEPPMNADERG